MPPEEPIPADELQRYKELPTKLEEAEFQQIQLRRIKVLTGHDPGQPPDDFKPELVQHERDLVGLAFSGGGIRSATFALGLLQGLAKLDLLKHVDYLSTVSGGGYIGSWFAAWVKREGDLHNVNTQLSPKRTDQAAAVRGFDKSNQHDGSEVGDTKAANGADGTKLEQFSAQSAEPEPIFHLRQYSNYFAPRLGLFSLDTWGLAAVYLRNLLSNLLALLPAILFVFLIARAITLTFTLGSNTLGSGNIGGAAAALLLLVAFAMVMWTHTRMPLQETRSKKYSSLSPGWFATILTLLGGAAILLTWLFVPFSLPVSTTGSQGVLQPGASVDTVSRFTFWLPSGWTTSESNLKDLGLLALIFGVPHAIVAVPRACAARRKKTGSPFGFNIWWPLLCGLLSGAIGGALFYLVLSQVLWPWMPSPGLTATFGPPLLLLVYAASAIVEVALLGTLTEEREREWWNSLIAWLLILSVGWMVAFGVALYAPLGMAALSIQLKAGLLTGWIGTTAAGLWAARSNKTTGEQKNSLIEIVSTVAPFVFLVGLLFVMSGFARFLLTVADDDRANLPAIIAKLVPSHVEDEKTVKVARTVRDLLSPDGRDSVSRARTVTLSPDHMAQAELLEWNIITDPNQSQLFFLIGATGLLSMLMSCRVDVNEFSLNAMNANRLTRCYLGASRRKVKPPLKPPAKDPGGVGDWAAGSGTTAHCHGREWFPDRLTGFDPNDDLDLFDLRIAGGTDATAAPRSAEVIEDISRISYWGPYPLYNTALNLVAGDELAWQERMAESFVLSPLYCGNNSLGYCPTRLYAGGLKLGQAVAISGAAVSPNMGYHSAPVTAAMMALFNVRMAWWLPNPKFDAWKEKRPWFLLKWLAIELFSRTSAHRRFLNVSDGGHFENLGVYELVRRRCRCIIVSDAGADPNFEFQDLAGLIRKCRIDFGIDIEIDLNQLRPDPGTGRTARHCAIGTIRYDHVEPTAPVGTLIYIKPSLTGDESTDVQHYAESHSSFPQQPTVDQFFDESQFESYRALGYCVAQDVFSDVAEGVVDKGLGKPKTRNVTGQTTATPATAAATPPPDFKSLAVRANEDHHAFVVNFVYSMQKKWLSAPSGLDAGFLDAVKPFVKVHQSLRQEPALSGVTADLYPELADGPGLLTPAAETSSADPDTASPPHEEIRIALEMLQVIQNDSGLLTPSEPASSAVSTKPSRPREEIHIAVEMLQVMENAWVGMKLNKYHAHPLNAGWMNLFKRWGNSRLVRRYWHVLRHEFSREFVSFCERELPVRCPAGDIEYLADVRRDNAAEVQILFDEFEAEWPGEKARRRSLANLSSQGLKFDTPTGTRTAVWVTRFRSQQTGDQQSTAVVAGLIGIRPLPQDERSEKLLKKLHDTAWKQIDEHRRKLTDRKYESDWAGIQELINNLEQQLNEPVNLYEVMAYVRPAFRQQGIGQKMVEQLVCSEDRSDAELTPAQSTLRQDKLALRKAMGTSPHVILLFPKARWNGPGNSLTKKRWMNYFTFYDFRRPSPEFQWPQSDTYEVLVTSKLDWQNEVSQ